jgi:tripartite-type tricarboxylate transporter receptor subunit TctC
MMIRAFCLFLLAILPSVVTAQGSYPNKPVRMIIPSAPGGASDFVGRIVQPRLSELLGQQIVVDNRPGAAGNIGVDAAARSAPDGYTLFLGNVGSVAINPSVFPNLQVNPLRDLVAVTQVVDVPSVLIAHPSLPANSVREFVAYAKANPGKLNYASPGSGSQNRLEMEVLRQLGGLDMVHVPYKGGAGPAVSGLIGGETQVMFVTASSAMAGVKAGRLKILGVCSDKRLEQVPAAQTMNEQGYSELKGSSWQGVFVPVGTPKEIVERLHEVLKQTMTTPEVVARLATGGVDVVTSPTPAAFAAYVAGETQRWAKVVKESNATPD